MDNHETLRASYKLYIAGKYEFSSSTLIESGTYKFGSGGYYGVGGHLDYDDDRVYNQLERTLRVDGSLVLVAEVEFVSKPLLSKLRCTAFKLRESSGRNDCTLMVGRGTESVGPCGAASTQPTPTFRSETRSSRPTVRSSPSSPTPSRRCSSRTRRPSCRSRTTPSRL
jgi:hypothetical protein